MFGSDIPMGLAYTAIGRLVVVPNGREPEIHSISQADAVGEYAIVSLDEVQVRLNSSDIVELWDKRIKVEQATNRGFNTADRFPRRSVRASELAGFVGQYAFIDTGSRTHAHRIMAVYSFGDGVLVTLGVTEVIGKLEQRLRFAPE